MINVQSLMIFSFLINMYLGSGCLFKTIKSVMGLAFVVVCFVFILIYCYVKRLVLI